MKIKTGLGTLLLAIYLIILGLSALFNIRFDHMGTIQGILALAAGVLLLLGK